MTLRQRFLKLLYPFLMRMTKNKNENILSNMQKIKPAFSFFDLQATLIDGKNLYFSELKGKKILIVNTASDCGYTSQYTELEKLYQLSKDKLIILGFPANDFKEQEKAGNDEIAAFCKKNFGVSFLLMQKSKVVKGDGQNAVFSWLSDASKNGWNDRAPVWNFSKYLVNENGVLTNYFAPGVSPLGDDVLNAIEDYNN